MSDTIQLTQEKIAQYRVDLADNAADNADALAKLADIDADNADALAALDVALAALDVIEEWDGDLADAAESIATRNEIEGVYENAVSRWFVVILQKCRTYICQPKYERLREKYFPALIPPLTEFMATSLLFPPGVASILSAPIALYIQEEGMDKFCQISTDD